MRLVTDESLSTLDVADAKSLKVTKRIKLSGLGLMVEILCAVLAGSAMANEDGGIRVASKPSRTSQTFLAIDIARFMPVEEFTARLDKLVGIIKATPPASGYNEVLVAGDPEWRTEAQRRANGVPVEEGNWKEPCETAAALGVNTSIRSC
jgi:LDH2 family malate/lactate/ureidoglycolate dehydrogenase